MHFGYGPTGLSKATSAMMLGAAIVQSALLYGIYRTSSERLNGVVVAGAAIMAVASCFAICAQGDAFAYIAYAKLGSIHAMYAPPVPYHPAPGFESMWVNLPACVYGPLWALVNWLLLAWTANLGTAFLLLRLFAIALLAVMAWALRKLDFDDRTIAVAVLNPFFYFYYVAEAHNDLFPIVLVLAGAAIAKKRPLAGALVAACAGLVKLSFTLIAIVGLNLRRTLPKRLLQAGTVLATVAVVSILFGGAPYLHAMLQTGTTQFERGSDPRLHLVFQLAHVALWLTALAAAAAAFFLNAFLPAASYAFYGIAGNFSPWYLGWGIPYAAKMPTFTTLYLAMLPAIGVAIDPLFTFYPAHPWLAVDLVTCAMVIAIAIQFARSAKRVRTAQALEAVAPRA